MSYKPTILNTPEEVLAITKAWLDGKPLQKQNINTLKWEDRHPMAAGIAPFFSQSKYRIKPDPVEIEVWYNPSPRLGWRCHYAATTHRSDAYLEKAGYRKILLREVLQDNEQ